MHLTDLLSPITPLSSTTRVVFGPSPIACPSILFHCKIEACCLHPWTLLSLSIVIAITAMTVVYNAVVLCDIPTAA